MNNPGNFAPYSNEKNIPDYATKDYVFCITLEDGTALKVRFRYITSDLPHYSFYGDISETGYRSHFIGIGTIKENEIIPIAKQAAEYLRAEFLLEQMKMKKKKQRRT